MQMSLMGAMPVTRENIVHVLDSKEPIDIIGILMELGYERGSKDYFEAWDKANAILQPMCKRGQAHYCVYAKSEVFPDGVERGVYYHKFSLRRLPQACGTVSGYEKVSKDDDDE